MCKKPVFLIAVVFVVCMVGSVRGAAIFHWQFDGTLGDPIVSDTDIESGAVATKFQDSGVPAPALDVEYGNSDPWYNTGGTSADFLNDPCDNDPGVGLRVPDTGIDTPLDLSTLGAFTIEAFIYPYTLRQSVVVRKYGGGPGQYYVDVISTGDIRFSINADANAAAAGAGAIQVDTWHHVAAVFDESHATKPMRIYVDGVEKGSATFNTRVGDSPRALGIGCIIRDNLDPPGNSGQFFHGRIDEVRISDEALDPSEFLLYGAEEGKATHADPYNGAAGVCPDVTLSWSPGPYAAEHDVYLGTDFADVNDATTGSGAYKGSRALDVTYYDPGGLEFDTTYYWRIDEVNDAAIWKGIVWKFTTEGSKAHSPSPVDGLSGALPSTQLSWTANCLADSHDVYLGTNFDDVNDADTTWPVGASVHKGNYPGASYNPGGLDITTTYYWRIDGVVDSSRIKGDVWNFTTSGIVADPNLIIWYKFDEVAPSTDAADSSGYGNHGEVQLISSGAPTDTAWDSLGFDAGCINFDGNVKVVVPPAAFSRIDSAVTVALWINGDELVQPDVNWGMPFHGGTPTNDRLLHTHIPTKYGDVMFESGSYNAQRLFLYGTEPADWAGEWNHYAFTVDPNQQMAKIYHNGSEAARNDSALLGVGGIESFTIGCGIFANGTVYEYYGKIDDFAIFDYALSDGKIGEFAKFPHAYGPYPADGATRVPLDAILSWKVGVYAADPGAHEVYFGTDYNDVNEADTTWPVGTSVYKGSQDLDANSYDPLGLALGTVYYWRIDEVNAPARWRGDIWSFKAIDEPIDPNLTVWYKFNETGGTTAHDSSGYDRNGQVDDDDGWDPDGHDGGCLSYNDNRRVDVPSDALGGISDGISICMWLEDAYRLGYDNWVFEAASASGTYIVRAAVVEVPSEEVLWRAGNDSNDVLTWNLGGVNPRALRGWHHWAFVKDEAAGEISIYFDGELADSNDVVNNTLAEVRNRALVIGAGAGHSNDFIGKTDDFKLYDRALSADEVLADFRGGDVNSAWAPDPYDGQTDVPRDVVLIWKPGDNATSHDVYWGTDWDDVNDANTSSSVFVDNREPNEYDPPGDLQLNTAYYWRIDEVNDGAPAHPDSPWKGRVWEFTVANFIIIDDMEAYNQTDNWIFDTWEDGVMNDSGSEVALGSDPCDPVHGGGKSMIYLYENDYPDALKYSEVSRAITDPCDWTDADVKILTLFFYGDPNNDANATEQMYVGLEDSRGSGSYAEVRYGLYGEDMNDMKEDEWQQWDIALSDFTAVDMNNIKKVHIGFGDRENPVPGGNGFVYFDDIRLYPAKCVPWRVKPEADFTDDCIVNLADVGIMAEQWLRTDAYLATQNPGDANLVGWWQLEEDDGNDVSDSSGNAYGGTAMGDYAWAAGRIGAAAMEFDGGWVAIEDEGNTPLLRPTGQVSVAAWIYRTESVGDWRHIAAKGEDDQETFALEINRSKGLTFIIRGPNSIDAHDLNGGIALPRNEWIHVAGTYDGSDLTSYVNGQVELTAEIGSVQLFADVNDGLGIAGRWNDSGGRFIGTIDDVRVYDKGLSAAEVAYFATEDTGYAPLASEVNLYDNEPQGEKAINFRDLARLMDSWGEEILWPSD